MDDNTVKEVLAHYGVKGQRWGVRRKRPSGPTSSDYRTAQKLKGKRISAMSNEELRKVSSRIQLEKSYRNLNASTSAKGKNIAEKILKQYGNQVVGGLIGVAASATIAAILKRGG